MCKDMNSFSIKRCWLVLRWLVSVNRIMLLGEFAGTTVAIFLIELGMFIMTPDPNPNAFLSHVAGFAIFCLVLSVILFVSLAFTKFTQLGTKQQRATFLMLPAMNLEKFLAVIFYVTVVCTIVGILSFVVADSLRMGSMAMWNQFHQLGSNWYPDGNEMHYTYWWSSAVPEIVRHLSPGWVNAPDIYSYTLSYRVMSMVLVGVFILFVHAHYTLGATLLRRYSFVIASIVLILWMFLSFRITMHFEFPLFRSVWMEDHYISQEVGDAAYIFAALLFAAAIGAYWNAYRIFKQFEPMTNQWLNANKFKDDDILKR